MTNPDANAAGAKKHGPPPSPKPSASGIPLAALWPKEAEAGPAKPPPPPPAAVPASQPEVSAPQVEGRVAKPVEAAPVAPPPRPPVPASPPAAAMPAAAAAGQERKVETAALGPGAGVQEPKPVPGGVASAVAAPVPAPVPPRANTAAIQAVTPPPPPQPAAPLAPPAAAGGAQAGATISKPAPVRPVAAPSTAPAGQAEQPPSSTPRPAVTVPAPAAASTPASPAPRPAAPPAKKNAKPHAPRKHAAPAKAEVSAQPPAGRAQPAPEAQPAEAAPPPPAVTPPAPAPTPAGQITEPAPSPARPARPSLFIAMVASECAPVAKVGGLGDVVYGLSRELEIRGNSVEVFLPKYDCLRYDQIYGLQMSYKDLWVPWNGGAIHCSVYFGFVHGRKCFFIEPHSSENFFNRRAFYGQNDDVQRFAFFSRAALEFMLKSGKRPDVIHCHDWQTALVPVLLYEMYKFLGMTHPRVCFTLHNLQHQGITGEAVLRATGLNRPEYYCHPDRLQDNANRAALNLMKGGIVYANFVTTVSPHYAWEIMNTSQDYGLGRTLHTHRGKLGGILNGLDYDTWNPEVDRHLPQTYTAETIERKYANKRALRQRFWLQDAFKPIVTYIGRLDHQKGVPLITHAIHYCLQHGCQFVLLGTSPDARIAQHFWGLKRQYNDNPDCHLEISFNEELSHLIYAGADLIIVPSLFEPCGLTQLIGLKYGTVPVVRGVGGLADTVFDANYATRPYHERNGYVFNDFNPAGLESALSRAIGLWYHYPQYFRELMLNAMRTDYSWNHSGEHYLNVYDYIRDK